VKKAVIKPAIKECLQKIFASISKQEAYAEADLSIWRHNVDCISGITENFPLGNTYTQQSF